MTAPSPQLLARTHNQCELCEGTDGLSSFDVPSATDRDATEIVVCATCLPQLDPEATLDPTHWFGLQGAIWSEHAAVQVASWRLLSRLANDPTEPVGWALELLGQVYLAEEALAWAKEGAADNAGPPTLDSNGATLADGDAVTLIKDLDVKGAGFVAKRGTLVKGIRLTENPEHIEGRVNGVAIVLKTQFLKKA